MIVSSRIWRAIVAMGAAAAVAVPFAGCGEGQARPAVVRAAPAGPGPCGKARRPPARYAHVVWVVMENHAYGSIIGSSAAPFETRLAAQCGSAADFRAESHPSLPNYIAMTSGSTQRISDDAGPSAHGLAAASIFSQLGGRWRALQESMPSPCALADAGEYAVRHNPATYYTRIRAACRRQDVPLGSAPDLSAAFTFVTPNLCNDMHDCAVATGDRWLQTFLGKVFRSREYRSGRTAVFLTWDEDDSSGPTNHIATIVAAPSIRPGTAPRGRFTHYSMLRTTEELLGLRPLGAAAKATSMRRAFGF